MSEYEDLYGDMLDMIEIITTSIEINSREEHFYRRSAEATSSEVAKGLFSEIADELGSILSNRIVVCHTHFDRVAMHQASRKDGIPHSDCRWLDSARVARHTWDKSATKGYGLRRLCDFLGYEFNHHDALEDAKAAGYIFLAAMKESGLSAQQWLEETTKPIFSNRSSVAREANPEGPCFGEVVVFTGALEIPRAKAADMAATVGCQVDVDVSPRTTVLVVGDQDAKRLRGHTKSSKHRKAERLAAGGYEIRIIKESDFKVLLSSCETP